MASNSKLYALFPVNAPLPPLSLRESERYELDYHALEALREHEEEAWELEAQTRLESLRYERSRPFPPAVERGRDTQFWIVFWLVLVLMLVAR